MKLIKYLKWRCSLRKVKLSQEKINEGRCLNCEGIEFCPQFGCPCKHNENLIKK